MTTNTITCGIALCTCNGMSYLQQQLDSLLIQTRQPEQMVIFDDCSDDGTWTFLQNWASHSPIPVTLHQNPRRLGVIKNFEIATNALDTDVIFLCDQDDIWLPEKIEIMIHLFASAPDLLLVHSNAILVDADALDLHVSLFAALDLSLQERAQISAGNAFYALSRRNLVTGATTAFRRSLLKFATPFPTVCLHDEWLGILAASLGRIMLLDDATILYRQHGKNVAGMPLPSFWRSILHRTARAGEFHVRRALRARALLERLRSIPTVPQEYVEHLRNAEAHAHFRAALPSNAVKRIAAVLREFRSGRYKKFSNGTNGVLRDILNY